MIPYKAPPTIARFLSSNAFARVIKGPVGSGKTSGCVVELLRRACEQAPFQGIRKTRFAVIRNTYRQLEDTSRRTFCDWVLPSLGAWRKADFTFDLDVTLPDGTRVQSEIMFRSLNGPDDVKKLLSLELTGAYLNELREIPKQIIDQLDARIGRFPAKMHGGASWKGWWADTNPWHVGHWGYKLFKSHKPTPESAEVAGPPPGFELYVQPSGRSPEAENLDNLDPDYYSRLCNGKDREWVSVFVDGLDGQSDQGSVFGALVDALDLNGRMQAFEHPDDGVFTSWDLGKSDATAIWFWRLNGDGGIDFIDHYESAGKQLSHFFEVIDKRGYNYIRHWLPHDAKANTLAAQSSVEDQFRERYKGKVQIVPRLSVEDGIAAGRWLLEQPCRFHPRTAAGIECLREYHYEWDDTLKIYSRTPVHDFSSHSADAFRYGAIVAKVTRLIQRKPTDPEQNDPNAPKYTLDKLFEDHANSRRRNRI